MVDFNVLSESEGYARDNVDREIKECIIVDWNNEEEIERIRSIAKQLLSHGYYCGAKRYKDLYSHAKEECLSLRGQMLKEDSLMNTRSKS